MAGEKDERQWGRETLVLKVCVSFCCALVKTMEQRNPSEVSENRICMWTRALTELWTVNTHSERFCSERLELFRNRCSAKHSKPSLHQNIFLFSSLILCILWQCLLCQCFQWELDPCSGNIQKLLTVGMARKILQSCFFFVLLNPRGQNKFLKTPRTLC